MTSPADRRARPRGRSSVFPTPRTAAAVAAMALLWSASGLSPIFRWAAIAGDLVLLALAFLDFERTPGPGTVTAVRRHDPLLSLGAPNEVSIEVVNQTGVSLSLRMRDRPPPCIQPEPPERSMAIDPGRTCEWSYSLVPTERGSYEFGDLWVRTEGALGLVARQWAIDLSGPVRVYPDIQATRRFETLLIRARFNEIGVRAAKSLGAGREFSSLREYQPDDELRAVDWNATARRVKLIVKQYEVERSQQVIALIDCGRLMTAPVLTDHEGRRMAKLDFAVNAALVFAYVSLALGDRAGLMTFAEHAGVFVPPGRGRLHMDRILESLYAVRASSHDSSFADAYLALRAQLKKRALLLVFTDLVDPETARTAIKYLALLARRHLCVCIALSDPEVVAWASDVPATDEHVYRQAAALQTLQDRRRALAELARAGVQVVDTLPESLTAESVNAYLRVKNAGLV